MKATRWFVHAGSYARPPRLALLVGAALAGVTAAACLADLPDNKVTLDQVARGRLLVIHHDCATCHNPASLGPSPTRNDPSDPRWLSGAPAGFAFRVGPGSQYKTYPSNLTPDKETGLGLFTDRQIFNSLRYGLDPEDTPDVTITSTKPGQGGFPAEPHYLAMPMPWTSWRHMSDGELWDMVAYLKHGIKAVGNKVPDSEGPADHWASSYTTDKTGPYPLSPYPSGSEDFKP